jgi:CheY-like chemotaxis protein
MQAPFIVFVDDDPDDRELIQDCLLRNNIDTFEIFDSGIALFEYLEDVPDHELPELIVADLNMPVMTGYEIVRQVKATERLKHIPVVLLSTSSRTMLVEECIKHGAAAHFQKPNSIGEFNQIIHQLSKIAI